MLKIILAVILMANFLFTSQVSAESYSDSPQWVRNFPAAPKIFILPIPTRKNFS